MRRLGLVLLLLTTSVAAFSFAFDAEDPPEERAGSADRGDDEAPSGPCLLGSGASARDGPMHPRPASVPAAEVSEDPWLAGGGTPSGGHSAGAEENALELKRLRIGSDGGVDWKREVLSNDDLEADDLVVYDIRGLLAAEYGDGSALDGHEQEVAVPGATWCQPLDVLLDVARALGSPDWQGDDGMLAWNEAQECIYVRVPEAALSTVEAVLDDRGARLASVVPVSARYAEGDDAFGAAALRVEVPWGVPVRSWQGTSWTYLQDFDVEISMGTWISGPIWGTVEAGFGLSAVRVPSPQCPEGALTISVALAPEAPRFEDFEATLAGIRLSIELPHGPLLHWSTCRLEARARTWTVPFGETGRLEVQVGEPKLPAGPLRRAWRRLEAVPPLDAASPGSDLAFSLCGSRSGDLGRDRLSLAGRVGGGVLLRAGSAAWLERVAQVGDVTAALDDAAPPPAGSIRLDVVSADRADVPARLDLRIAVSAWSGDCRTVDLPDHRSVEVPSSHTVLVSRRLPLSQRGEGTLTFEGDIGRGPERFTLTVWRTHSR